MLNAIQLREAATPVNPRAYLSTLISGRLCQWVGDCGDSRGPDTDKLAHPKVTAVVAIYDDALARLKGKTGERADAARAQISAARTPLASALDLVNSIQGDFDGPLSRELEKRIATTRAALASALAAREVATRATIDAAVLECERCLADLRELDRDLASVYEKLSFPTLKPLLPNFDEIAAAKQATASLEAVPAKRVRAADVHAAIEQGLKAPAHVAVLWIAYETKPVDSCELLQWRWRGFAERAQ
jgi:hypothetical protein